jgi:hypothetical protein
LRESISKWLHQFYSSTLSSIPELKRKGDDIPDAERICITGGASQNLACVLQVFTDPVYTRVWMVAPCYFLACRIFEDAGLRTRAVGEGEEGVDLVGLERRLVEAEREMGGKVSAVLLAGERNGEGVCVSRDGHLGGGMGDSTSAEPSNDGGFSLPFLSA